MVYKKDQMTQHMRISWYLDILLFKTDPQLLSLICVKVQTHICFLSGRSTSMNLAVCQQYTVSAFEDKALKPLLGLTLSYSQQNIESQVLVVSFCRGSTVNIANGSQCVKIDNGFFFSWMLSLGRHHFITQVMVFIAQ